MAKAPITDTVAKWNQRFSELQSQGVDTQPFETIAQKDIRHVQQGGTGMSNQEARAVAMAIISGGKQPFAAPKRPTGPLGIFENIIPDIGDVAKGLWHMPGNLVKDISKGVTHPELISQAFSQGSLTKDIRKAAQTPLLDLIPGLHTVAGLTTSEGRKELQRHPVGTLVDIAPYAIKGLSVAAKAGALGDVTEGSVAESLAGKKVGQAIYRGLPEGAQDTVQQFLRDRGIHPQDYKAIGEANVANRRNQIRSAQQVRDNTLVQSILALPKEEQAALLEEARTYRPGMDIPPQHEAIISMAKELEQQIVDMQDGRLVRVMHNGKEWIYPAAGEVGRAHAAKLLAEEGVFDAHDRLASTIDRKVEQLQAERDKVAKEVDRHTAAHERHTARAAEMEGKGSGRAHQNALGKARDAELKAQSARINLKKIDQQIENGGKNLPEIRRAQTHLNRKIKASAKAEQKLSDALEANPPGAFDAMIKRDKLAAGERIISQRGNFNYGVDEALARWKRHDPTGVLTEQDLASIDSEVKANVQRYMQDGYDPLWIMNVEEHGLQKALSSRILPLDRPTVVEHTLSDLRPGMSDMAVAVSANLMQLLRLEGSEEFINTHLVQHMLTPEEVSNDLHRLVQLRARKGKLTTESQAAELAKLRDQRYVEFDPAHYGVRPAKLTGKLATGKMYLPRDVAKALDDLQPRGETKLGRTLTGSTHLYKTAVMGFSLKHLAHIVLGGTVFLLGRGGLQELNPATWAAARELLHGDTIMPELVQVADSGLSPHDLVEFHAGGTIGRMLNEVWTHTGAKPVEKLAQFEQFMGNMQRAVAFLSEEKRGLAHGMTPEAAREAGLLHAQKALVDMDHFSTFERTAIKRVFPFYGYTRHILRYALTYPIDHPLRAAIITRLAEMEMADRNSSLPQSFENLFFIGNPDAKGNVTAVDIRPTNPFRDLGTTLTFAGLVRSLNPAIGGVFAAAGMNVFTGTPDLYPELTVDPNTGSLIAKRPPNAWFTYARTFVPELQTIDDLFQVTQQTRQLYANNPNALWNRLYASLFIPFGIRAVNIPQSEAQIQANRERIASAAVSKAMKGIGSVANYPVVPYGGQLVSGQTLQDFIDSLHVPSGMTPKAVLPKPRSTRGAF